ncbi:MAG: hypothetical protein V3T17_01380 [Pseudomonadales bacterium]
MKWIALFIISSQISLASAMCEDFTPMSTRGQDGTEVKLVLPGSKVFSSTSWSPEAGEPPLSISSVFQTANNWASENLAKYDHIVIESIALKKYGCPNSNNKEYWYYMIDYSPSIDGQRLWGSGNWLSVLMSGEVIEPVRK